MPPSSSTKNEKSSIRPMIMMKAQKSSIQSGASAKLMMPKRSAVEPALVRLADDRELLARQSAACRTRVEERFSWSVTAAAVERALIGA